MLVCRFFRIFAYISRITILLTKTTAAENAAALSYHNVRGLYFLAVVFVGTIDEAYISYAHHQNGLNEDIKIMCFICRFNVYFSRNQRKCSQNGEDENLKFEIYEANGISSSRA